MGMLEHNLEAFAPEFNDRTFIEELLEGVKKTFWNSTTSLRSTPRNGRWKKSPPLTAASFASGSTNSNSPKTSLKSRDQRGHRTRKNF